MEAVCSFGTLVDLHRTPRRCIAGDTGLEEVPDQKKLSGRRRLVSWKLRARLEHGRGPAGTRGWGVQLPLPMNDRGRLAYPADRSSREEDFISLPNLDGHGPVIFDSSRVEPRASVCLGSS